MNSKNRKTNKAKIGGILTIISGILASLGAVNYDIGLINVRGFTEGDIPPFVPSIIFGVPVLNDLAKCSIPLCYVNIYTATRQIIIETSNAN